MTDQLKLYLDVCCLNRPFDSWAQDRIRFEGQAVLSIFERIRAKQWQLISSEAIEAELQRLANPEKLTSIQHLISLSTQTIILDAQIDQRSQELENLGFGLYDSFHIACAETAKADVLLTTDDRMINRGKRYNDDIQVPLSNPVTWLMDVLSQGETHDDPH